MVESIRNMKNIDNTLPRIDFIYTPSGIA